MDMKAAVIYENGDPEVLRHEDVPDPECQHGFVIVDAEAISIEGGDLLVRAMGELAAVPHVVGYLSAGTISDVGAGADGGELSQMPGHRVPAVGEAFTWPSTEGGTRRWRTHCDSL
jgi:NADPH2:quinone reductase